MQCDAIENNKKKLITSQLINLWKQIPKYTVNFSRWYPDFLILIAKFPLKHLGVDTVDVYYVFLFWLLIIMIWWVFGFGRIFSGAINTEPFMGNFDLFHFNIRL